MEYKARYPSYCTGPGQDEALIPCKSKNDCCVGLYETTDTNGKKTQGCAIGFANIEDNDCLLPESCEDLMSARATLSNLILKGIPTLAPLPVVQLGTPNPAHLFHWTQDLQTIENSVAAMLIDNKVMTHSRGEATTALVNQMYRVSGWVHLFHQKLTDENAKKLTSMSATITPVIEQPTLEQASQQNHQRK